MKSICVILSLLFLSSCCGCNEVCTKEAIAEVGVCDRDGYCAVKSVTGKRRRASSPMVGDIKEFCVPGPEKPKTDNVFTKMRKALIIK